MKWRQAQAEASGERTFVVVAGSVRGGHLLEGHVWPTLEVVVRETPAQLRKTWRPEIGLALIDLERPDAP